MRAIGAAVSASVADSSAPDALVRGHYRRLKIRAYRVMYIVEVDVITIEQVNPFIFFRVHGRPWSSQLANTKIARHHQLRCRQRGEVSFAEHTKSNLVMWLIFPTTWS
jgi:hypothetical protein